MTTPRSAHLPNLPLVAIVTPVYNGADFLQEALESVQAQTYPNLVHVVLDNASTDATPHILGAFRSRRVPLRVARNQAVVPQCENWNRAMALAPAEAGHLRLLCHDDTLEPGAIARCVEAAERDPAVGLVACSHIVQGEIDHLGWRAGVYEGHAALQALLRNQVRVMPPQTLYARAALPPDGRFFVEPPFGCFDGELMLKMLAAGFKLAFVADPLCTTRVHGASVSSTMLSQEHRDWFSRFDELLRYAPKVFSPAEASMLRARYRRAYLRLLLRISLRPGAKDVVRRHLTMLRAAGQAPSVLDLLDAVLDWPFAKLGLRQSYWTRPSGSVFEGEPAAPA